MSNYIGVKQADGTITRVLTYKLNNSQNISCAPFTDDQEKVKIDFYYMPEGNLNKAQQIGTLSSDKLKHLKKGKYNIQITINIDRKGKIHARMRSSSGGRQKTISMALNRAQSTAFLKGKSLPSKKWGPLRLAVALVYGLFIIALILFLLSNTFIELSLETLFGIKL